MVFLTFSVVDVKLCVILKVVFCWSRVDTVYAVSGSDSIIFIPQFARRLECPLGVCQLPRPFEKTNLNRFHLLTGVAEGKSS